MSDDVRRAAIIIPVHNAPECVTELLDSMSKTEVAEIQIETIFVDDASDKETSDILLKYCLENDWCEYLRNNTQQLFTRTVNRGIRSASRDNDFYVCVNTDCVLKYGWLNHLIEPFDSPECYGVAITGYYDGTPEDEDGWEECFYPKRLNAPDYVTGHCIALDAKALRDPMLGVFCETDLRQAHIGSEREWCWRAAQLGYRMFYVKGNLCVHDKGGPSWNRDLRWLASFDYSQLWKGSDQL